MKVYCPDCARCFDGEVGALVVCPHCLDAEKKTKAPKRESPEAWRAACERAVFNASVLLRLAKMTGGSMAAVAELIRSAPRSWEDADNIPETALFYRVVMEVDRLSGNDEWLRPVVGYFARELIEMAPERRSMLEASVAGVLTGFMMG